MGFSDTLDALYLQGGVGGGTTRPLVLQGGGGDVYTKAWTNYIATYTGFNPAVPSDWYTIDYKKIGKRVFLHWNFLGTVAAGITYISFTLPFTAQDYYNFAAPCVVFNNTAPLPTPGYAIISPAGGGTGVCCLFRDCAGANFTAAGKAGSCGMLTYEATS